MSDPTLQPYLHGYYLWKYVPSLPGAIIFAILFASITAAHTWRLFRTRLWFCIPFTIGGYRASPETSPALDRSLRVTY